jgi:ACR3 family arsenite efflux pump ArsB
VDTLAWDSFLGRNPDPSATRSIPNGRFQSSPVAGTRLGKPSRTGRFLHIVLIAIPIFIQVYFNSSLTYFLTYLARAPYSVAAPGALIGASNFFELAVATAIALFGPGSGAAFATVVGVLVEVPVMLSVCSLCNRTRDRFPKDHASF